MSRPRLNKKSTKDTSMIVEGKGLEFIQVTDEQIIEAFHATGGLVHTSARLLTLKPSSLYARLKRNPDLKTVLLECREETIDLAESVLFTELKKGNFDAARFYLNHIGRDRGYGDIVTTQNMNMNINANVDVDLSKLSEEELFQLNELTNKITKSDSFDDSDSQGII